MLQKVKTEIAEQLSKELGIDKEIAFASLETPKDEFGDLTTRIAFVLAKERKDNPVKIAASLARQLKPFGYVEKISSTGPYLNFHFSNEFYLDSLKQIKKGSEKFGKGKKTGKKMAVEFFHANTHKGVHIGHIRNITTGEALCRVLDAAGNKVVRLNYQGDIGPHVAKCIWGFLNIYNGKVPDNNQDNRGVWLGKVYSEATGKTAGNPELEAGVQEINQKIYSGDKEIVDIWKKTRQWCLDDFERFYKEFGVKFDELYFESQTEKIGKETALELVKKGVAKKDQGAIIMDLKDEGLGVFVLITKEGYPLYSAKDLGLAKIKFKKHNPDRSIHVVGKEQELHFKQLFRTFEKAGLAGMKDMALAAEASHHLIYELVMLPEGKMSSREGTMVLYEDLRNKLVELVKEEVMKRHEDWEQKHVDETSLKIALAAIKFSMLNRESNKVMVFDWNQALSLEGESGPYIQYACVRVRGILDKVGKKAGKGKETGPAKSEYEITHSERKLIKKLCEFPDVVENSAEHLAVYRVANYLIDVAAEFSKFYNVSPVANAESESAKAARKRIVEATGIILRNGLGLLGIDVPERM